MSNLSCESHVHENLLWRPDPTDIFPPQLLFISLVTGRQSTRQPMVETFLQIPSGIQRLPTTVAFPLSLLAFFFFSDLASEPS